MGCRFPDKSYGLARRMIKGIGFALVVNVGQLAGQRLPLLRHILRADSPQRTAKDLKQKALQWAGDNLAAHEVFVFDAGAHISGLESASVKNYVLRLAANYTARRNVLPEYGGRGRRPQYGQYIRPLPRQGKDPAIAATPPDLETSFAVDDRIIRTQCWRNWVRSQVKVDPTHPTFSIWVFFDPLYTHPLVLATDLCLQPLSLLSLYDDRWPVEQVPLVTKQMLRVRLCPHQLSSSARVSHVSRQHFELSSTGAASSAHGLLGPSSPKD